jgi:hypothetical protein
MHRVGRCVVLALLVGLATVACSHTRVQEVEVIEPLPAQPFAKLFRFYLLDEKVHRADLLCHTWASVREAEIQPFATQASVAVFFKASYASASTALANSCGASWGRLWPTPGITRCS